MTGGENVYKYITTEGKVAGKKTGKITALEYLQKSTGVFNGNGLLSEEKVAEMKERLKNNKGNIWHGFVSLNKEQSYKIDTPEKCIGMIKATFGQFFQDAKLDKKNIDLMCALHLDRPDHLHFHFVFWEKEPKYKGKDGVLSYRRKGKIEKTAIDNLFVRLGMYVDDGRDRLYKSRVEAIRVLRGMTAIKRVMVSKDEIKQEIISLAKDLPKTGRLTYGSKDIVENKDIHDFVDMDTYYSMIKGLNDEQRQVVTLKVLGGYTHKEISKMLGKPIGTIQWLYNVSIKKLKITLTSIMVAIVLSGAGFVERLVHYISQKNAVPELPGQTIRVPFDYSIVVFAVLFVFFVCYIFIYSKKIS